MSKIYKIHPGIGVARVAPGAGYFIGGETPHASPLEIDGAGTDSAFTGYKDAASLMRRQAVRFRVFEYERNAAGVETFLREVTSADATIAWTVRLAAAKAAGFVRQGASEDGARFIVPSQPPSSTRRNPTIATAALQTEVTLCAQGNNVAPTPGAEPTGTIQGKPIFVVEFPS